ncbi:MAG: glycosyltransferase family 2 protein [Bacteroidetes bacterium]|jgi:cellulose synthase/poly-beta-1,6-N-acetylglucosamine synthase-like glycosyltransferase|nr:glycosyltransferase family 2 protein [Bacteroidota bacterium]MBT7825469.1 glycosyltransferase family 2 protein [Bacteroidota bacterium]MBT7993936.1 glycosyltransferase family 2 protein [Bacteroidota bacterium]
MEKLFWISILIIFYTYIGYGIVLYFLVLLKRLLGRKEVFETENYEPEVSLLIPAFNEEDYIDQKILNSLELDYPKDKIQILCITDGSSDNTVKFLTKYEEVKVLHQDERKGKIAAINRGINEISTPIVIFTDTNTLLPKNAIKEIVKQFANHKVGCVSGEKRIFSGESEAASTAGEGLYWKYESLLKRLDSELSSVVGAAGELFAIRTELYDETEPDTLLDDFMISLRIAMKGFITAYTPEAYAIESGSESIGEEMKRKVRISAGGIQSILRLLPLWNIFKYGIISFQYVSHRVLRWTLTPFLLVLVLICNILLVLQPENFTNKSFYTFLLLSQFVFYTLALVGWLLEKREMRLKIFFVPFYFTFMNVAVFLGMIKFARGKQSANWEKAKRSNAKVTQN